MSGRPSRISREYETIAAMVRIYCRNAHGSADDECPDCTELLAYADRRLEKCPFQSEKPPCVKCPIHCYQPVRREQVKAVMRYSGPRMVFRHPIFALRHWIDGFRNAPPAPRRRPRSSGPLAAGDGSDPRSPQGPSG